MATDSFYKELRYPNLGKLEIFRYRLRGFPFMTFELQAMVINSPASCETGVSLADTFCFICWISSFHGPNMIWGLKDKPGFPIQKFSTCQAKQLLTHIRIVPSSDPVIHLRYILFHLTHVISSSWPCRVLRNFILLPTVLKSRMYTIPSLLAYAYSRLKRDHRSHRTFLSNLLIDYLVHKRRMVEMTYLSAQYSIANITPSQANSPPDNSSSSTPSSISSGGSSSPVMTSYRILMALRSWSCNWPVRRFQISIFLSQPPDI